MHKLQKKRGGYEELDLTSSYGGSSRLKGVNTTRRCQILADYIGKKNNDLSQCIRSLCLEHILYNRAQDGTTFLYPTDEMIEGIIVDTFESSNAANAVNTVRKLVLTRSFKNGAEFEANKDNIVCKKGFKYVLDSVKGKGSSEVVKFNGFEITPADDFNCPEGENIVVWKIVKGTLPETGELAERHDNRNFQRRDRDRKEKGKDEIEGGAIEPSLHKRKLIALDYTVKYFQYRNELRDSNINNPMLIGAVSCYNFLETYYKDIYVDALSLIDPEPATTLYLLLSNDKLVPDECILGNGSTDINAYIRYGWSGIPVYLDIISDWNRHSQKAIELYSDRPQKPDMSTKMYSNAVDASMLFYNSMTSHQTYNHIIKKYRGRNISDDLSERQTEDQKRFILNAILTKLHSYRSGVPPDAERELREEIDCLFDHDKASYNLYKMVGRESSLVGNRGDCLLSWIRSKYFAYLPGDIPLIRDSRNESRSKGSVNYQYMTDFVNSVINKSSMKGGKSKTAVSTPKQSSSSSQSQNHSKFGSNDNDNDNDNTTDNVSDIPILVYGGSDKDSKRQPVYKLDVFGSHDSSIF